MQQCNVVTGHGKLRKIKRKGDNACVVCRYNCIPIYTIYDATALLPLLYIVVQKFIIIIQFKKLMSSHTLEDYVKNLKQVLVLTTYKIHSLIIIIFKKISVKSVYNFNSDTTSDNSTSQLSIS